VSFCLHVTVTPVKIPKMERILFNLARRFVIHSSSINFMRHGAEKDNLVMSTLLTLHCLQSGKTPKQSLLKRAIERILQTHVERTGPKVFLKHQSAKIFLPAIGYPTHRFTVHHKPPSCRYILALTRDAPKMFRQSISITKKFQSPPPAVSRLHNIKI